MTNKIVKAIGCIAGGLAVVLFVLAIREYPGQAYVYILFTIVLNALLLFGLRKKRIFFDTFIGLFFWLGYWLKFSFRMAFLQGRFLEPVGAHFDYSGTAYDQALLVVICGVVPLLLVSYLRGRFCFNYPLKSKGTGLEGLFAFYQNYRRAVWAVFIVAFMAVAATNAYFGIYQRGSVPRTILTYKLGGIYTWLLLFGFATVSATIIEFDLQSKKTADIFGVLLSLVETLFSNVSMLSRGMVLNAGALALGTLKSFKINSIKAELRYCTVIAVVFLILFGASIIAVTGLRTSRFGSQVDTKWHLKPQVALARSKQTSAILLLDRWVGIEGTMAVSSYPNLGWDLWIQAWQEKYANHGTSFYDLNIASSVYRQMDFAKHHFISLPGILAFLYYPGSFLFLFFAMFMVGLLGAGIEIAVYRVCGSNAILASLLAMVVASRYAHFGYVPARSYLLFGTLGMNVFLIFALNWCLVKLHYKNKKIDIGLASKQKEAKRV